MIYLLEDDDNIRKLILYTFASQNIEAMGFAKPSEFWEQINKEIPDIVLLDIMLPEEDGLDILKKLRNNSSTADITVIMLTATLMIRKFIPRSQYFLEMEEWYVKVMQKQ